ELAAATTEPHSAAFQKVIAEFETQLPALMAEHNVPGLSIAAIQDAKIAWHRAFGYKDTAAKTPADNDTIFQAGSTSKPVFAYAREGYYYPPSVITHLTGHTDPTDCAKFEDGLEICASDIDQFLIANVLAPFGMNSSGYAETSNIRRHLATGHDKNGKSFPKKI